MYKISRIALPLYFQNLFVLNFQVHARNTRQAEKLHVGLISHNTRPNAHVISHNTRPNAHVISHNTRPNAHVISHVTNARAFSKYTALNYEMIVLISLIVKHLKYLNENIKHSQSITDVCLC